MFRNGVSVQAVSSWEGYCFDCEIEYTDNTAEFYDGRVFHECPKCETVTESQE
jgi:hypothetical protein